MVFKNFPQALNYLLAIESSCDDSAVAILNAQGQILANQIHTQSHIEHGGIVPEIASRAHLEVLHTLALKALQEAQLHPKDLSAIAVTKGPGLIGSLMVGVMFAKGLSQSLSLPLIGVHHIEGHVFSGLYEKDFPEPPFVALIVSGGHTALYKVDSSFHLELISETRDDAAGEAFDKIGRHLGLSYPAGKAIDALAMGGDERRFTFPIGMKNSIEFSFSGLKTAAKRQIDVLKDSKNLDEKTLKDFCASLQTHIAHTLLEKAHRACKNLSVKSLVLGGGVSANSALRHQAKSLEAEGLSIYLPPLMYCTDNAAMIGKAALRRLLLGEKEDLFMCPHANLSL